MCGRFAYWAVKKLKKRFDASGEVKSGPSYNIAPGAMTPVVRRKSPNQVVMMKWGLVPFWAKDVRIGYKMINARAEGIENKPSFRKPIRSQRCLVPADGFYEWQRGNLEGKVEKYPWFVGLKNGETMALAGIWDVWKDAEGRELHSYAIITTEANKLVGKIHERMPVIMKQEDEDQWLNGETKLEEVLRLLKPYPAGEMVSRPVSRRVNNPENDDRGLVEEIREEL
jgi:putative SOS response-associated peptidase YedK